MNDEVRKRGYLEFTHIPKSMIPSEERMKKGKVPIIECIEKIPCNPCETSCPKKAIKIGENITNLPEVDYELCSGCAICVTKCPGLAIFMGDLTEEPWGKISIPWELLPVPIKGEKFDGINRRGEKVCSGEIVEVKKIKGKTHIVTGKFPKEYINEVRHFKMV